MSDARTPSPRLADLTGREVEVLRLIAKGATNRDTVEQLVMYVLVPYPQYYTLAFCKQ
jgi:DNA-binding NarL/FixJ family response regulator